MSEAPLELCANQVNVDYLRRAYCDDLLALRPQSVLDVGCGGGQIMDMLAAAGVACVGLETTAPNSDLARVVDAHRSKPSAIRLVQAQAEYLPFADQSVDWVSMRHVPHHLANPRAAIAEALRVARTGLFLAEPMFQRQRPSEALAEDVDLWLKKQHRRSGRVHQPNLSLDDMADLLKPLGARVKVDHAYPPFGLRSAAECVEEIQTWMQHLPEAHCDRLSGAALVERLRREPISWNGSHCMTVYCSR